MTNNLKDELQKKFENTHKGCTLFAIHLDGFSHDVFYKDENGKRHIDGYSAYAPEQHDEPHDIGGFIRAWNDDKTKVLFAGCPHYQYQNNAKEFVYQPTDKWAN